MAQARDEQGNIWEVDAQGNPVRLVSPAGAGRIIPKEADPTDTYKGPKAAADLQNTQSTIADRHADNARADQELAMKAAMQPYDMRTAQANAAKAEAEAKKASQGGGMLSATERANAITGYQSALALDGIIADLERKFREGPGSTSGIGGIADYLPTSPNQRFDNAANAARGIVGQALGFTGGQLNSEGEARMNVGPYIPQASDKDGAIQDAIGRLRALQQQAKDRSIAILGGVPDENGNITPLPNAMTMPRIVPGEGQGAAAAGSTTKGVPINPDYQREYTAWVQENAGDLNPEAYAFMRAQLDQKYGYGVTDPTVFLEEGKRIRDGIAKGGALNLDIPNSEERMTVTEQFRNDLVNNPVGGFVAGMADMGGFGVPSALAPEQFSTLRDERPYSTTGGSMLGAVVGTGAVGKIGAETLGKALTPRMAALGRMKLGRSGVELGKNLATDAAYSGVYGGVTGENPLESAAWGAAGSLGGQALASGLGRAMGGVDLSPAVQALKKRGVSMSAARQMGDVARRIEDKAVSLPFVGDMIRRRSADSFADFNRAAFEEAGRPINFAANEIGEEGVDQLRGAVGQAYDNATAGVTAQFDPQFMTDFGNAAAKGQMLPPDLRRGLGEILDARVAPMTDAGQMSGEQYQQAIRALKASRKTPPQRFQGFENDYREAVTGTMDALTGQMQRAGGQPVVDGLSKANAAHRNLKIIENASLDRARVGTRTGQTEVFAPSQLVDAARAAEKKFPGANPLKALGKTGQEVLPSTVPNSGTTDRLIQAGLGATALGGAGAADQWLGSDNALRNTAIATALLTALGTKAGQKALTGPIANAGRSLRKGKKLFGSAAVPLLITN